MKRKLLTLVGLSVTLLLTAAPITKETARKKALQFLTERGDNVAASRGAQSLEMQLRDGADVEKLHVFNVGQKEGFVIISGDDCTGDLILGYADRGEISTNNIPDNLRAWLQGYSDQISWMQQHGIKNEVAASRALTGSSVRKPVSPVMATLWNQGEPYNNYCPKYAKPAPGNSYYAISTVTGCVATAVAQVMYYQATKHGKTKTETLVPIPAYYSNICLLWNKAGNAIGNVVEEKPKATIDWSAITAGSDVTPVLEDAKTAVALLMEYIGAGLQMQYGTEEMGGSQSSSSDIPYMLKTYFGYDANVQCVERNNYTYSDWLNLIYQELTTNGPVLYSGQSTGGGHSFVLDGYSDEDYFYVNWGWGGMSNGYFKLSVMYSDQQGIGGSTSQDGYSFFQDAIINVNPINSGIDTTVRLTVSDAWSGSNTYNRSSSDNNFTSVQLHSSMFNYTEGVQSFEYGFALYQDGVFKQILWTNSVDNLGVNFGWSDNYGFCSFGAGLDNGTYQLIPVSRQKNTEVWYPDFGSELHYIVAIIEDNTLTLQQMGKKNITATLAISGNTAGSPVTITATVTNKGSVYSGDLYITANNYYAAAMQVEMAPNTTKDFVFTYTPMDEGSYTINLMDKDRVKLATAELMAVAGDATTGELSINWNTDITLTNAVGNMWYNGFYGSTLAGQVKITNTSTNVHNSGIALIVWQYNGEDYSYLAKKTYPTNVAANGGTQVIDFEFSGLTVGTSYLLTYHYNDETEISVPHYSIESLQGITTYTADGTKTIAPAATVNVADNVLALDISGITGVTRVNPNSNPNTIYIIGSADNPSGLNGKNVVKGGIATTLTVSDDYDFYTPIDFTATTATYTRKFTVGANGTGGWSTIVLPFEVSTVKQGGKTINWFHNSSDTGDFWLKEFVYEDGGTVYFDFADNLYANTPYIIAVPGNKWGNQYDLTNKDITFYGSNVTIQAIGNSSVSGNNYKFDGTTVSKTVTDSYLLNSAGENFVLGDGTLQPFRACFKGVKMLVGSPKLAIASANSSVTAISEGGHVKSGSDNLYYNLQGQRVNQPRRGMYIVDGKKIIVK